MPHVAITHPVQAPGKMMWLGEYAVLDGAPAIVAAINRYVHLTFDAGGDTLRITSNLWDGPYVVQDTDGQVLPGRPLDVQRLVFAVVQTVADALPDVRWPNGVLHIDASDLHRDAKLGLGSSGAVAAGLTVALAGSTLDERRLLDLALSAHHTFQGRAGSGSDVMASMLGGVVHVGGGRPPMRLWDVALPCFVALYTGESADTRDMMRRMRAWRDRAPADAEPLLKALADVARRGAFALRANDRAGFIDAVERYTEFERRITRLSEVPIMSPSVERLVQLCLSQGYLAKPSGAGGGDVVVAFHHSPEIAYSSVSEAHARVWLESALEEQSVLQLALAIADEGALSAIRT